MTVTRLRASVTHIEAVRKFRTEDWMTYDKLMAQLRGGEEPSAVRDAGTALHSFLETAVPPLEVENVESEGFRFTFACDLSVPLRTFRELRGSRVYDVGGVELEVRAKVDGLEGAEIDDHKLTGSTFDAENYFESYQWRLYLSIFRVDVLHFNVFTAKEGKTDHDWTIREFNRFTMTRYPELEDDVRYELFRYIDFAKEHLGEDGKPS